MAQTKTHDQTCAGADPQWGAPGHEGECTCAASEEHKVEIVNGWLVEVVDQHTCGAGPGSGAGHEPDCGLVPITSLEHVFELLKAEVEQALAASPISIYTGHENGCRSESTPLGEFPECNCSVAQGGF